MTGLTYRDREDERGDHQQQEQLLAALDAAPAQLRRDECGSWVIAGRRGTIQTWCDGKTWVAYVIGRSTRHWTAIKQRLAFMTITQDGDEEGCFRLFALPTAEEALLIRDAILLRKRRALTEASRAALIAAGVKGRFQAQEAAMAPGLVPDTTPVPFDGESAAYVPINAVATTEPEQAV